MYYPSSENKSLISFAVTAKLICVFVFAHAKSRFSHNEALIKLHIQMYSTVHVLHKSRIEFVKVSKYAYHKLRVYRKLFDEMCITVFSNSYIKTLISVSMSSKRTVCHSDAQ